MGYAAERADDHAKTVVQRHRNAHTVGAWRTPAESGSTRRNSATRCPIGRLARARGASARGRSHRPVVAARYTSSARADAAQRALHARDAPRRSHRTSGRWWRRSAVARARLAHSLRHSSLLLRLVIGDPLDVQQVSVRDAVGGGCAAPHPHPNVSDGTRPVVSPIRPCVAGEFTRMRLAGIDVAKRLTRRSSEV